MQESGVPVESSTVREDQQTVPPQFLKMRDFPLVFTKKSQLYCWSVIDYILHVVSGLGLGHPFPTPPEVSVELQIHGWGLFLPYQYSFLFLGSS